jgi:hypothetical protein
MKPEIVQEDGYDFQSALDAIPIGDRVPIFRQGGKYCTEFEVIGCEDGRDYPFTGSIISVSIKLIQKVHGLTVVTPIGMGTDPLFEEDAEAWEAG